MHRVASGAGPRISGCDAVAGQSSGGCARGRSIGGWTTAPGGGVSAPQGVGSDSRGTSAGADAQIFAAPAFHHRLLRQGQLSRPARLRSESRAAATTPDIFRVPLCDVRSAGGLHPLPMPFASILHAPDLLGRIPGTPPGNTRSVPCSQDYFGASCRGGEFCPWSGMKPTA